MSTTDTDLDVIPTVTTDLLDYQPGETSTITASDFVIGSTLEFQVLHVTDPGVDGVYGTLDDILDPGPDGISGTADDGYGTTGAGHDPWYVTDGVWWLISAGADGIEGTADDIIGGDLDKTANGSITTTWYVNPDDSAGSTFLLTATGDGADGVSGTADDQVATTSFTDSRGSYSIDFSAADPTLYERLTPSELSAIEGGTANNPLPGTDTDTSVESLAPASMGLGQIVAFEFEINVNGSTSPENGTIQLTAGWDTETTSGDPFGFDAGYGVYGFFLDTGDSAYVDPGNNANVTLISDDPVGDHIEGVFQVSGLDDGDNVVLEVWMVLDNTIDPGTNGNVQSNLIDAEIVSDTNPTAIPGSGGQTIPLNKVQEFFTAQADLSVIKSDSVDASSNSDHLTTGDDPDPATAYPTGEFTYTVLVTNNSTDTVANDVVVYDELDSNVSFVSASDSGYINTDSGDTIPDGAVQWDLGFLNPGESKELSVTVQVSESASSDLLNTVTVTSLTDDPDLTNNTNTEPTLLGTPPQSVISGLKYHDLDQNGALSPGEVGLQGWTIDAFADTNHDGTLQQSEIDAGTEDSAVTDVNGNYTLNLPAQQDFIIVEVQQNGWMEIQDTDSASVNTVNSTYGEYGYAIHTTPAGDFSNNDFANFQLNPSISITKTNDSPDDQGGWTDADGSGDVSVGDTITYSYVVANTGNVDLSNVTASDDLLGGITLSDTAGDGVDFLAAGDSESGTLTYEIQASDLGTTITNIATADSDQTDETTDTNSIVVPMPSMSISKTPDITSVDTAGQVINYTIVVTNTGSANLTNVTVNDPLLSDESPVLNSGYNTGDTNTNNILDVGEAWNYSGTYTVQQSDIDNNGIDADGVADGDGDIDNTVTADSDQTDPVATSAAVGIVYDPHLAIVKDGVLTDGGDGLNPGDTLDYTFKVTNTGNVTITGVGINEDYFDLFPVHGESIDITPPADVDLSPGEMQTWTGSYTLTQADIDYSFTDPLIDNTASATGQDTKGDDVTSNQDTAQIELPTPPQAELLSLVKDGYYTDVGGDGLNPGDTLTYTFDVTNDSIYTITNVYIDEVSFDLFPIGGSINITPPADTDLSPDESQQWTGEYTLTQDDIDAIFLDNQIDNVAQAIGTDPGGGDTTSNEDPAQITLTPVASLEVNKTVEGVFNADDSPDTDGVVDSAGDYIVYGVTVTNTGEVTLTGVDVQDQVDGYAPVNLYLSGDTNMNGVRDGIEDWTSDGDTNNDGELDVGETWTYSYTYDVQQSDIDVIGNLEWQNSGQEPFQGGSEYDAWFIQGSDYPATGSGVIDSFVRIQANGTEQGYNTDYRPQQFDEGNTATFNHSILVSDIPVVTLQGDDGQSHDYWEFRLDLNEQDGNVGRDQITLDALQLYVSSSNDLTNFDTSTGTFTIDPGPDGMVGTPDDIKTDGTPLYDLGASVDLNEWTSGSGHGDYTVLVPYVEGDYTDQYMYLYSAFSNTDGGFEEWYVRKFGLLDNTATVSTDQGAGGSDSAEVTVAADANYFMDTSAQLAAMNTVTNTLDSTGANVVKTGDLTEDNVIDYTVTLHNDGNVTLGNVEVTDQVEGGTLITLTNHDSDSNTFSGDDNGNGSLDLGETWTYTYTRTFGQDAFDVNGDALLTNTVMVNSDATHTLTATSTVDVSSLIFVGLAMNAHSADWWANHPEAWDGDLDTTAVGVQDSDLGMDDVLIPVDSNGDGVIAHSDQQGVLIGDLNADGLTDNGETTLFVPLDAAQQLIDSSGATDMREVLMAEALAAQLNINNMSADSTLTDHPEGPNNLVSEAAMWLRGLGDYSSYDDQTTGNVDTNGDGILSVGNNSNFEFDMKDDLFSADADLSTPMTNKDPGDPLSDADFAWGMVNDTSGVGDDGADLNQALSAFNSGDLVVDPHGGYVGAVDSSGDVVDVHPNAPDAFWDVVL